MQGNLHSLKFLCLPLNVVGLTTLTPLFISSRRALKS
jgi:hypothetical protein